MATREQFLAVHQEAIDRGARCTECPLFNLAVEKGKGRGPVMGRIQAKSKLVVIGEAPGNQEVEKGEPFVGASGRILDAKLSDGGLNRHVPGDVSLTNTLLCQPPDDYEAYEEKLRVKARKAGREAVLPSDCCYPRLKRDIQEANAPVEYAVGRQALKAVAHYYDVPYGKERKRERDDISIAGLRKQHGAPIIIRKPDHPDGAKVVIASYHPAYAMRGAKSWMPVIKTVIERAAKIATRGGVVDWTKPVYNLNPTLDQIEAFAREAVDTNRLVMIDIETGPSSPGATDGGLIQTCALRTIGWGFRRDPTDEYPEGEEVIMVVPYKDMAGQRVWHDHQYERLDTAIRLVMDEAQLAGQNFSFDSAVLLRLGLMTRRKKRWADVMLAHHDTDSCDLPHDLGFIISEHFEAPHHKCVSGNTPVVCADGSRRPIKDLVAERYDGQVLGLDETGRITASRVVGWVKNETEPRPWVSVKTAWGNRRSTHQLTVTDDHLVYTPSGPVPAGELHPGQTVLFPEERLSDEALGALLGTALGDGAIKTAKTRTGSRLDALGCAIIGTQRHFNETHCLSFEKQAKLPHLITCSGLEKSSGYAPEHHRYVRWRTPILRQLQPWLSHLIRNVDGSDIKYISTTVLNHLGPVGWAWLLMDDGSHVRPHSDPVWNTIRQSKVSFALNAFDLDDLQAVAEWCRAFFQGSVWVSADGTLTLGVPATRNFAEYVARHIPSAFRYKLPYEAEMPSYDPEPLPRTNEPVAATIQEVTFPEPSTVRGGNKSWCLTTSTGNFFTSYGLVKNCDVDHKSVNNVDYELLKQYNGDDVLTQLRCLFAVLARVEQLGTMPQFVTDTKIAPICRDAGDLGLVIDEDERQRLAKVLTERIDHFRAKFRFEAAKLFVDDAELKRVEDRLDRVMQDVKQLPEPERAPYLTRAYHQYAADRGFNDANLNPNSVYHLRTLFFDQLQLTPILNTDGWEFDEEAEDDPSTSQAAILKLMEKYDHIAPLCDALLEYRAYHKLYGTYVADKKGRIRDVDWTKWGLPPNDRRRILNTVYKVHVIPSGRLSTQPAIQNWPAVGKANMRTMVVSPDGHCIVGADYDQLELRIYAVVAQDQLLLQAFSDKDKHGNPIDPHSLNAASLLAESEGGVWDEYYRIKYDMTDKQRKYWRTVAKRFCYLECIAEGSPVLTPRGLVPIEDVTALDKVWDGVQWVEHDGVIFKGFKEVITWDGVTATPDHKVWLEDGATITLGTAAEQRRRLARTGAGRDPVRFLGDERRSLRAGQPPVGDSRREPAEPPRMVAVYDILNAGPRRRFTVNDRLVSNCYGGEEEKLFQTMAASRDKATGKRDFPNLQPKEVEVWHNRWHKMHPETKRWQENVKSVAYARGEVRVSTLDRRARFWPGGIDKKNAPPNHTIQGFAASIANKAIIELEDAIPHRGWSPVSGIILQVHDYIGAYVPRERAWEAKHLVEECLGFSHGGLDFTCTAEVSYRWSDQG